MIFKGKKREKDGGKCAFTFSVSGCCLTVSRKCDFHHDEKLACFCLQMQAKGKRGPRKSGTGVSPERHPKVLSQGTGCSLAPSGRGGLGEPREGRVLLLSRCCRRAWEDPSLPSRSQDPGPSWLESALLLRSRVRSPLGHSSPMEGGEGSAPLRVRPGVVSHNAHGRGPQGPWPRPLLSPRWVRALDPYSQAHTSLPILTTHGKI